MDIGGLNGAGSLVNAVGLALPRLLTLLIVLPVFNGPAVPIIVRGGVALALAAFVAPTIQGQTIDFLSASWIVVVAKEVLIGLLLGFAFSTVLWAVQNAGHLIDFQTGLANATFFDPISGHQDGPTAGFLNHLAIALLLLGGGFQTMLSWVFDSFRIWPIGSFYPRIGPALAEFAITQGDTVLSSTVKIASAVIIILLLAELGLGLISRAAPELNVFSVSQPLKSGLAVLMMALFLNLVYESLRNVLDPHTGLGALMRAMS